MTTKKIPERQKPAVRKSTLVKDSSNAPRARKVAAKRSSPKKSAATASDVPEVKKSAVSKTVLLMIVVALISSGLTYTLTNSSSSTSSPAASTSNFTEVIAGKVALTEEEFDRCSKATWGRCVLGWAS